MQLHRIEQHLYPKALGMIRHRPLGRKQGKLLMPPAPLVEPFDHPAPRRVLTVVDLAQIQNRMLHHPTARTAPAFDNAPITVLLAVLTVAVRIASTWPAILCTNQNPKRA